MDFLRKKLSWAKENPDLSLPLALILLVALCLGGYFLLIKQGSPYQGLQDPDRVEIRASSKGGEISLTRQDIRALQELDLRSAAGWEAPPGGDPELFKKSIIEFCAQVEEGSETQAACRALVDERVANQRRESLLYLWAYLGLGNKLSKQEKARIYEAGMIDYRRLTRAGSNQQALEKIGLSPRSAQAILVGQTVFERKVQKAVDPSPSQAELLKFYQRFRFRYATQPVIRLQAASFASRAKAEEALGRTRAGASWSSISRLDSPTVALAPADLPPGVGQRLLDLPLKTPVLIYEKGVWSVGRATRITPAKPPPGFNSIKDRVKKDWLSYNIGRAERRISDQLYRRFNQSSRCSGGCPRPLFS